MASETEVLRGFFSLIRNGRGEGILPFVSEDFSVDDPLLGKFEGKDAFLEYIYSERNWLSVYETGIECFSSVSDGNSTAVEFDFKMQIADRVIEFPVAFYSERKDGVIAAIRIYYSTWPLYGTHRVRSPVVLEDPSLVLPEPVKSYMESINGADSGKVLDLFDETAYVREPSGNSFRHQGKDELREFYDIAISGGGIPLKHCRFVSDGKITAVEYFFNMWNNISFPEQAGIAFYEISRENRITAVRIYDDADPQF